MSKALEENKFTDKVKRLLWEFNLYWKFMCTEKKIMIRTKQTYTLFPSTLVIVFLIAEKIMGLWLWNLQTFSLFLLSVLWKVKRNCMSELFCIGNLLEIGQTNCIFFLTL